MRNIKNLLITGGAGFIGFNFVRYFSNKYPDIKLHVIDNYAMGSIPQSISYFVDNDINLLQLSINSVTDDIIEKYNIDSIVHFAAESHVDRSITNPSLFVETNVLGTLKLLQLVKKFNLYFHHISTDEVFGDLGPEDAPFSEFSPYNPHSPYSASKAASDHLVRAFGDTYGIDYTISNCSNNYGPFQNSEKLIPKIFEKIRNNQKIPIYGNGKNIRNWLYVLDHCKAIDTIMFNGKSKETYLIGSDIELDNIQISDIILKMFNKSFDDNVEFVSDRKGHDFRYAINYSKIQRELGWEPETTFEEGIRLTYEFYNEGKI